MNQMHLMPPPWSRQSSEYLSVSQTHSAFLGEKDHLALDAYPTVCCAVATCSRTSLSEGQWAERDAAEQGVAGVDVSWIEGQWEAWQSHCQFLMGSLCFDAWLAHSDGTIIQDHEADFESRSQSLIQITQTSVSPLKGGCRKLSRLFDPHLMT